MSIKKPPIIAFLKEIMRHNGQNKNQLSADFGVSHSTISRWLAGSDMPNTNSCRKLAEYAGVPLERVLSIAGHIPPLPPVNPAYLPNFRAYAYLKYPDELDEDLISMIEYLIKLRRRKRAESELRKKR